MNNIQLHFATPVYDRHGHITTVADRAAVNRWYENGFTPTLTPNFTHVTVPAPATARVGHRKSKRNIKTKNK